MINTMCKYILVFFCMVYNAHSSIIIDWTSQNTTIGLSSYSPPDNDLLPSGSLALLIWTGPDNSPGELNPLNPLLEIGDDRILDTRTTDIDGYFSPFLTVAHETDFSLPDDAFVNTGFIYVRIFEDQNLNSGTEWGQSRLYDPVLDGDPVFGPPPVEMFDIVEGANQTFILNQVIIPEPSAFIIMMLGGLIIIRVRGKRPLAHKSM